MFIFVSYHSPGSSFKKNLMTISRDVFFEYPNLNDNPVGKFRGDL